MVTNADRRSQTGHERRYIARETSEVAAIIPGLEDSLMTVSEKLLYKVVV